MIYLDKDNDWACIGEKDTYYVYHTFEGDQEVYNYPHVHHEFLTGVGSAVLPMEFLS